MDYMGGPIELVSRKLSSKIFASPLLGFGHVYLAQALDLLFKSKRSPLRHPQTVSSPARLCKDLEPGQHDDDASYIPARS
jgi:hypothetical protein